MALETISIDYQDETLNSDWPKKNLTKFYPFKKLKNNNLLEIIQSQTAKTKAIFSKSVERECENKVE